MEYGRCGGGFVLGKAPAHFEPWSQRDKRESAEPSKRATHPGLSQGTSAHPVGSHPTSPPHLTPSLYLVLPIIPSPLLPI